MNEFTLTDVPSGIMDSSDAAKTLAQLVDLVTQGQPLAVQALPVRGGQGDTLTVFAGPDAVMVSGPAGARRSRATAQLLMLASQHAAQFARALASLERPGTLAALCRPVIDGYDAGQSPMEPDMLQSLIDLGDHASAIQHMELQLLRTRAALRGLLRGHVPSEIAQSAADLDRTRRVAEDALGDPADMRGLDDTTLRWLDQHGARGNAFVMEFLECAARAEAEEKRSAPSDWTPEQRTMFGAGDVAGFSASRGYTEAETANFERFAQLALALDDVFGEGFSAGLNHNPGFTWPSAPADADDDEPETLAAPE